ncbi:very-long-chain 3-oxoacyl-CoA reductase-like protein At1g24470 isoform X2 [Apium graveolens]|uniref:very-long-chain 3-oxoacyl-CoA reductase-like protein At1g24470 isoform X2 n=1 Tax=Apium graveolens TaxID=4045 RepID=UPI003D790642
MMLFDHLEPQPFYIVILLYLGIFIFLKKSFYFLNWIFITFLRPPKNLKKYYGSWALITGSTDGIGKAMAFELARKGLNLVLVSRNLSKLDRVSRELLAENPNIQIKNLVLDFSGNVVAGVREMQVAIKGLEIGVLINNAGVTYHEAMYFHEVEEKVWMNLVNVNLRGTTLVTRAVVKGMIKRRRGAIVNIGSAASVVVSSHPLYIHQLSRSLYVEYKHYGIDVQCQVPLYVSTKMAENVAGIKRASMFIPSAEDYAKAAVKCIGYEIRCTPYWPHAVQWFFASLLPDFVLDSWRFSVGIRRRSSVHCKLT